MSYRITEAERKHIATIEDTIFEFRQAKDDPNRIQLIFTDNDKLEKSLNMPRYNFKYIKDEDKIILEDDQFGTFTSMTEVLGRYEIECVYDNENYLIGFNYLNLRNEEVTFVDFSKLSDTIIKNLNITNKLKINGNAELENTVINGLLQIIGNMMAINIEAKEISAEELSVATKTTLNGNTSIKGIIDIDNKLLVDENGIQINNTDLTFNNANIYGENAILDGTVTAQEINSDIIKVNALNTNTIASSDGTEINIGNIIINNGKNLTVIDENTDPKEIVNKEYLDSKIISGETGIDISLLRLNYNEANQELRLIYNDAVIPNAQIPLKVLATALDNYWGLSAALDKILNTTEPEIIEDQEPVENDTQ